MKSVTTSNLTPHAKPLSFRQSLMMLASATVVTLSLSAPAMRKAMMSTGLMALHLIARRRPSQAQLPIAGLIMMSVGVHTV